MFGKKIGLLALAMAAIPFQGCLESGMAGSGEGDRLVGSYAAMTIPGWNPADGYGSDITISPQGEIYRVDLTTSGPAYSVSQKTAPHTWVSVGRSAFKVSAGPNGDLWAVAAGDSIWRRSGGTWSHVGYGKDVAAGANGDVYKVDVTPSYGTFSLSKWNGSTWSAISGAAKKIVVAPNGTLWAITAGDDIWSYDGTTWTERPGTAKELAVDAAGTVFKLDVERDDHNGGHPVQKWNGSIWDLVSGYFVKIAGSTPTGLYGVAEDFTLLYRSHP